MSGDSTRLTFLACQRQRGVELRENVRVTGREKKERGPMGVVTTSIFSFKDIGKTEPFPEDSKSMGQAKVSEWGGEGRTKGERDYMGFPLSSLLNSLGKMPKVE